MNLPRRYIVAAGLVCLGAVIIYLFSTHSLKSNFPAIGAETRLTNEGVLNQSSSARDESASKVSSSVDAGATQSESTLQLNDRLDRMDRELKAIEKENARMIWSGEYKGGRAAMHVISKPNEEQYSRMNAAIQASLRGLEHTPEYAAVRKSHERLFMDYARYRKDLRVLYVRLDPGGGNAFFIEGHVDNTDELPNDGSSPLVSPCRTAALPWDTENHFFNRFSHIVDLSE